MNGGLSGPMSEYSIARQDGFVPSNLGMNLIGKLLAEREEGRPWALESREETGLSVERVGEQPPRHRTSFQARRRGCTMQCVQQVKCAGSVEEKVGFDGGKVIHVERMDTRTFKELVLRWNKVEFTSRCYNM